MPQILWHVGVGCYHVRSYDVLEELAVNVCLKTVLMKGYSYMVADTKYYCLLEVSKHVRHKYTGFKVVIEKTCIGLMTT